MQRDIKTLSGVMNLDDSNEVIPQSHHKEARNGVFKGDDEELHFTAIRGNSKVDNSLLIANDCRIIGSTVFTPNCDLGGTALYIGKCDLAGTAINIVNFNLSVTCALNDGVVVINGLTGGSGVYQISNVPYFTEAAALAGTSYIDASTYTFNNTQDGIFWFVVRDKNNPSNKFAKSISISCDGTIIECRAGFTIVIGVGGAQVYYKDCCGNQKNVLLLEGTHNITDCTLVGSVSSPDNIVSITYSTTVCTATSAPNWVNKGYTTCYNCVNSAVSRDENPCSATYLKYRAGTTILTTTAPAPGACNYNAAYTEFAGLYHTCFNGTIIGRNVTRNTNPCFTGNQFYIQDTGISYANNPANAFPDTEPNIQYQYPTCVACYRKDVYKDINECSGTYGRYYVDGADYGLTAPMPSLCNYDPNYNILEEGNYYKCVGGTIQQYDVYKNSNVCYGLAWRTSDGLLWTTDPTNLRRDLEPLWQNLPINEAYECDYNTFIIYYVERDNNPLSCTYNATRRGGKFEENSATCGYTPPNNYVYSAIRCSDYSSVNIISANQLMEGYTYSTTNSGLGQCYSSLVPAGTTTDPATTYYLLSPYEDCGNTSRCQFA